MRRYTPMKESRGTVIPPKVRDEVRARDGICVAAKLLIPHACEPYRTELDHVRASGGLGMKSPSTPENLVLLCGAAHRMKTEHGRAWRPLLIAYVESFEEAVA